MTNSLSANFVEFPASDLSKYRVDLNTSTCACPKFESEGKCHHLEAVGRFPHRTVNLSARPSFSQGLSGLVKGIRVRDIDEAAHWLNYCWSFREKLSGSQFRIIRRLLIGAAEDGHSIAVMEKLADNFVPLLSKEVEFERVMAELLRICKVPNWWVPETGGHDYIYQGMLGVRRFQYDLGTYALEHCLQQLEQVIRQHDKAGALYWVMKAHSCGNTSGLAIAYKLHDFAAQIGCNEAYRLMQNIYLRHERSLRFDANFTCQAAWFLAGGVSPVANQIESVTLGEVRALIERVNAADPHVIPGWCCDGVHCAGNDIRYSGLWDRMYAVCNQYNRYRRVKPEDPWVESEFYCLDGLTVVEA